ncbi:NADP-dependent oxidoreductase [Arthrobacter sp. NEB 688]|uniref:NADP-dependent oxidoreductase n=1 Tax=Arthrobacter sp. NEB 688 TaxID=904039 RepID=UPI001567B8C3|nr:NADP-dependent oxidoreductase [Arthrobacter sp. NEB 688]QKE82640.1 NADP-dependent oxidoreductase [Arthrobacter sp. NEB 688]
MHAFVIDSYKSPLHAADVPEPTVGEHDLLVEVGAAGLNQLDEKIRLGEFTQLLPYRTPLTLGHDVAGTVVRVGPAVHGFAPGDVVFARPRDHRIGTFAERIAVHEDDVALAPRTASMAESASLPLVALTAWQALVEIADVRPGQKVLVHAGAGGVGTVAIQLAKHLGAHVATTASGTDAVFLRELGADVVVDYRTEDFAAELSVYDVVLDSLGGENLLRSLGVLRRGGTAIGIAGPPTTRFAKEAGLNPVLRVVMGVLSRSVRARARRLGVEYRFLFMRADGRQLREVAALVDSGAIRPVVGRTYPFDETVAALAELGKTSTRGKTVVTRA